jgi:hypothetical protein
MTAETATPAPTTTIAQLTAHLIGLVADGHGDLPAGSLDLPDLIAATADAAGGTGDLGHHLAPLVAALGENRSMDVYHAIKSKFDWAGTVFVRQDVLDQVRDAADGADLSDEQADAHADKIMASYEYRRLGDRFAEHGNETLYDLAVSALSGTLDD